MVIPWQRQEDGNAQRGRKASHTLQEFVRPTSGEINHSKESPNTMHGESESCCFVEQSKSPPPQLLTVNSPSKPIILTQE